MNWAVAQDDADRGVFWHARRLDHRDQRIAVGGEFASRKHAPLELHHRPFRRRVDSRTQTFADICHVGFFSESTYSSACRIASRASGRSINSSTIASVPKIAKVNAMDRPTLPGSRKTNCVKAAITLGPSAWPIRL